MNCRNFQDNLLEYLDGSLSPEASSAAEQHLETCSACREVLQRHKMAAQVLSARFHRDTEGLVLRAGIERRILRAAEEAPASWYSTALFWRRFAWISAAAALLVLAVWLVPRHAPPAPVATVSLRLPVWEPVYSFHKDGNFVIDTVNYQPRMIEESLKTTL